MKKIFAAFLATLMMFLIQSRIIDFYPETAVVTEIKSDIVTVTTFTGNEFQFSGVEDWMVGDIVSMIMNGNNTDDVKDDEIISVKYSGFMG